MFDIGWSELLVIGVVALIVVGPQDLPGMFRTLGRFTAKARGMARDFQRAMNEAADEAGVKDVTRDLKNATSAKSLGLDALNRAADSFEKWDPGKPATKPRPDPDAPTASETATKALRAERDAAMKRAQDNTAADLARKAEAKTAPAATDAAAPRENGSAARESKAGRTATGRKAPVSRSSSVRTPGTKAGSAAGAKAPARKAAPKAETPARSAAKRVEAGAETAPRTPATDKAGD